MKLWDTIDWGSSRTKHRTSYQSYHRYNFLTPLQYLHADHVDSISARQMNSSDTCRILHRDTVKYFLQFPKKTPAGELSPDKFARRVFEGRATHGSAKRGRMKSRREIRKSITVEGSQDSSQGGYSYTQCAQWQRQSALRLIHEGPRSFSRGSRQLPLRKG